MLNPYLSSLKIKLLFKTNRHAFKSYSTFLRIWNKRDNEMFITYSNYFMFFCMFNFLFCLVSNTRWLLLAITFLVNQTYDVLSPDFNAYLLQMDMVSTLGHVAKYMSDEDKSKVLGG